MFNDCQQPFRCLACLDLGHNGDHRAGSGECSSFLKVSQDRRTLIQNRTNNV